MHGAMQPAPLWAQDSLLGPLAVPAALLDTAGLALVICITLLDIHAHINVAIIL